MDWKNLVAAANARYEVMLERYNTGNEFPNAIAAMEDEAFDEDEDNPMLQSIIDDPRRNHIIYGLTGFTFAQFMQLYAIVHTVLEPHGRGRRSKVGPKDLLFLLLYYLKSYDKFESIAAQFRFTTSTTERLINNAIGSCFETFRNRFIQFLPKERQTELGLGFNAFPDVAAIVDVTFQPVTKPLTDYEPARRYFSGKHWQYGIKS